jgi:hypothetical protein
MKIKFQRLPTRCEICHQTDLFDSAMNFCRRCSEENFLDLFQGDSAQNLKATNKISLAIAEKTIRQEISSNIIVRKKFLSNSKLTPNLMKIFFVIVVVVAVVLTFLFSGILLWAIVTEQGVLVYILMLLLILLAMINFIMVLGYADFIFSKR